jgi:hypothetical protein
VDEAQAGIRTIPLEGQTNTHPSKSARLVATTNGWTAALDLSRKNGDVLVKTPNKTAAAQPNVWDALEKFKEEGGWEKNQATKTPNATATTPTFTEVSDRLMERKLVGKWKSESNYVTFFAGGQGADQEINASKGDSFTWAVKKGMLVIREWSASEEITFKFFDNDTLEMRSEGHGSKFKRVN